jgi:predicted transcriptional regulator
MTAAHHLRYARRRAGLTQRELSAKTGVPQATIARIEKGRAEPRFALLDRLLRECGQQLLCEDLHGRGIDRSLIRAMLSLDPRQRLDRASEEARNLDAIEAQVKIRRSTVAGG